MAEPAESLKPFVGGTPTAGAPVSPRLVSLAILQGQLEPGPYLSRRLRAVRRRVPPHRRRPGVGGRHPKGHAQEVRDGHPQHTLQTILQRATREKLAEKRDGLYFPNSIKLAERVLTPQRTNSFAATTPSSAR